MGGDPCCLLGKRDYCMLMCCWVVWPNLISSNLRLGVGTRGSLTPFYLKLQGWMGREMGGCRLGGFVKDISVVDQVFNRVLSLIEWSFRS